MRGRVTGWLNSVVLELDPGVWGTVFPDLVKPSESLASRAILGYRINRIHFIPGSRGTSRLALTGLGPWPYFWEPGRNVAFCCMPDIHDPSRPKHQAPARACGCGLYACHDLGALKWTLLMHTPPNESFVLTAVAGSGLVRVHKRGWRAQFARIVAFSYQSPTASTLLGSGRHDRQRVINDLTARALVKKYQVPVVPLMRLREVMRGSGEFWEEMQ